MQWRDSLALPIVELEARILLGVINSNSEVSCSELACKFVAFVCELFCVVFLGNNGNDDELCLGDEGRQDESLIVGVDHNHGTN